MFKFIMNCVYNMYNHVIVHNHHLLHDSESIVYIPLHNYAWPSSQASQFLPFVFVFVHNNTGKKKHSFAGKKQFRWSSVPMYYCEHKLKVKTQGGLGMRVIMHTYTCMIVQKYYQQKDYQIMYSTMYSSCVFTVLNGSITLVFR